MPVGGLERYSGLQGGGFVELGKDSHVKRVGDTPFFGKIVKWHVSNLSKTDAKQQTINRTVRQDFFVALQTANREIAQKYAQELVGDGMQGKPLSARRVREIVAEVDDWVRLTPEALQAWRERLDALRADGRGEIIN